MRIFLTITWRLRYNDAELYACDKPKCQVVSNYSDFSLIRFTYIRTYFTTHKQNMCIYIKSKLKKSEIVKKTTYFHDFNQPNTFDFFFREIKMEFTQKVFGLIFLITYVISIKYFRIFFVKLKWNLLKKLSDLFSRLIYFTFFSTFFSFLFKFFQHCILFYFFNFLQHFFFRSIQFCRIFRILLILSNFVKIKLVIFFSFQANDIFRQLSEGNEEMLNRVTAQLNAAHQGQATQGDQGRGENESNSESFSFSGYFSRLMRSNPEMVGVFSTFEKYIPFVLILVTKQLFDHSTGKNNNHTFRPKIISEFFWIFFRFYFYNYYYSEILRFHFFWRFFGIFSLKSIKNWIFLSKIAILTENCTQFYRAKLQNSVIYFRILNSKYVSIIKFIFLLSWIFGQKIGVWDSVNNLLCFYLDANWKLECMHRAKDFVCQSCQLWKETKSR